MGQLRGSATRALPPGPPTGATANRLRSGAEPVASTPASRIQQAGECAPWAAGRGRRGGGTGQPGPWVLRAASLSPRPSTSASPSRQYFSQSDLKGRQREEGEHEATQGRTRQRLVLRPHWAARGLPDFSLTGELPLPPAPSGPHRFPSKAVGVGTQPPARGPSPDGWQGAHSGGACGPCH